MLAAASELVWNLVLPDERATLKLARDLSLSLKAGDLVTLAGDLGAGKSTLARAIIRTLAGDAQLEVPSPTYTLLQTYELDRLPVVHADFYRVRSADELEEIGWEEAADDALALVEWPDRAGSTLAADRLEIVLTLAPDLGPEARRARLAGLGAFAPRLKRMREIRTFLDGAGWGEAERAPLAGDASSRRYERLADRGRHAVLMDAPTRPDGPPVRNGLPYSRIAHLAEDVTPFLAMARALRERGLSAPEVIAADLSLGLLIIEDLGDGKVVEGDPPAPVLERYQTAVEMLAALHSLTLPDRLPVAPRIEYQLPRYDIDAFLIEAELLLDWYLPFHGVVLPPGARGDFVTLWREALGTAMAGPKTWVLRDLHSPNLLWLAERKGVARLGLLDFQDAVIGPPAYDVVSLAQDARIDVSEDTELAVLRHYVTLRRGLDASFDVSHFARAYATFGAQRNTKILGIFARLNKRDGKPQYLAHLPRVARYLKRCLAHASLAPLAKWYAAHVPLDYKPVVHLPPSMPGTE
jgi:tRNA threonylcarbamoyl adenosine modification protein YjeE